MKFFSIQQVKCAKKEVVRTGSVLRCS